MKHKLIICSLLCLCNTLAYGQDQSIKNKIDEFYNKRQLVINQAKEKSEDLGNLPQQFANEIAQKKWLLLEENNGQYAIVDSFNLEEFIVDYNRKTERAMKRMYEKGQYHTEYVDERTFRTKKHDAENYYVLITDFDVDKLVSENMLRIDSLQTEMTLLSNKFYCYDSMLKRRDKEFENEEQKQIAIEIIEKMRVENHPKYKKANKDLTKGKISKEIYRTIKSMRDSCLSSLYNIAKKISPVYERVNFSEFADNYEEKLRGNIRYSYGDVNSGVSNFITKEIPKTKEIIKEQIRDSFTSSNLHWSRGEGNSKKFNMSSAGYGREYIEDLDYEDIPFYPVALLKVENPHHRNALYRSFRDDENLTVDKKVWELNEIDVEEQSKGFEWVSSSKYVEKRQDYPISVRYLEFEEHPEYRGIRVDGLNKASFLFNDQGELQRVTDLGRSRAHSPEMDNTYPRIDYSSKDDDHMDTFRELWRHVIKIAYDANKYNIKSKGEKTQKCIKAYITPPGLTKTGEDAGKAMGAAMFADIYYGKESDVAKRANRDAAILLLSALHENSDVDADNWMAQIRQDNIKDFEMPYEIKRVDNTTFDVIYVDKNLKPKWKLIVKYYTVKPYVANRVTKLVKID